MTPQQMLDTIGQLDYYVLTIPRGTGKLVSTATIAVADPLDDSDGFYLEAETISQAYNDMANNGWLDAVLLR